MEKEYIKDMKSSYLVLKGEGCEGSYKNKMLEQYTIPGLLRTEIRSIDNIILFYYDITNLKTVETLWKDKIFHFSEVKALLEGVFQTIDNSVEYFLEQDDFILHPEYLFSKEECESLQLCYFPGYGENIVNQLGVLFEFIMNKADYKEEALVLLIYALYKESREKNTTLYKLKEILKAYDRQEIKVKKISLPQEVKNPENEKAVVRIEAEKSGMASGQELNRSGEYEKQEEVSYYEVQTYIMGGAVAAVGIGILLILLKGGVLSNEMGEPDIVKIIAGIAVIVCLVGYAFSKLFNPKLKSTRMVTKVVYEERQEEKDSNDKNGSNDKKNRTDKKDRNEKKNGVYGFKERRLVSTENKNSALDSHRVEKGIIEEGKMEKETLNRECEYATQILTDEDKTEILYTHSPEPSYCLVAKNRENPGDIPINNFPFYVGKDKNRNQMVLKESSVSRLHAVLTLREGEVFLTDIGSTNGTYVNGQKVEKNQPVPISNSDELAFSREVYLFKINDGYKV